MKQYTLDVHTNNANNLNPSLADYGELIYIDKNKVVYDSDKPENAVFYLKKGCVKLVNKEKGINRVITDGQFFGDRSIFYSKHIYAEAITNIEIIRIDDHSYREIINSNGKLAFEIIDNMAKNSIDLREEKRSFSRLKMTISSLYKKVLGKDDEPSCYCS